MAKKKSKKKTNKKKTDKKKLLKLKFRKKKDKKESKKKKEEKVKKEKKIKASKKEKPPKSSKNIIKNITEQQDLVLKESEISELENLPTPELATEKGSETQKDQSEDNSANYNVKDATAKIREMESKDDILSFTQGEERVTVTKVITATLNKFPD